MKVCVLSGSPRGEYSITYQTVLFLKKQFPECEFETLHVGQKIRAFERDITSALEAVKKADVLLFCYPVYTFVIPCQLHLFIELLKDSGADLSKKCAAQISTSKHFYDVTAHSFIAENCADMGLSYLGGLSADMDDLLTKKGRDEAEAFWKLIMWRAQNHIYEPARVHPKTEIPQYIRKFDETGKRAGNEVVIVASMSPEERDIAEMIQDFCAVYPYKTRVVNVNEYPFSGGCLGCFGCAVDGKCIYKDGFDSFLRNEIQTADAIVYAFTIKDHSMGSRMKMYDDRQFCNGHRTVTMGKPTGYIICGDLANEPNLRMIIDGRADVGGNFLAGAATDSDGIADLAKSLEYALINKLTLPQTFLGVGGMKIFRDLIWLMRGMMRADHRFYKIHGMYDFPQKKVGTVLKMKLVGGLIANPKLKSKMGNKMNEGMIAPYKKVIDSANRQDTL